jgi:hypothetical protein
LIHELAAGDVGEIVITQSDWDHVLGIGHSPVARVTESRLAAEWLHAAGAAAEIEQVLVVGDYLSGLEIPFVGSSVRDYEQTVELLVRTIEDERPEDVIVGHGHPHSGRRAPQVAAEDLVYVRALRSLVQAGGSARTQAPSFTLPETGSATTRPHAQNVAAVLGPAG